MRTHLFKIAILAVALSVAIVPGSAMAAGSNDDAQTLSLKMVMDPSGGPTTSVFTVKPGTYVTPDGGQVAVSAASTWTCIGITDNPHWSSGSSSVIAKTRVSCTGPAGVIPITVASTLGRTPTNNINTLQVVATSQYTQNVTVNGSYTTWYVPAVGSGTYVAAGAYFRGSHAAQAAPPAISNLATGASAFVWVS